ncbi:cytochrome P450 alkane hydroxylase-like protein [Xylariomycetidae sp. FL2044]|nr:cytochrome P450 alkane hydroxylase-like protein [Xylariomycetidae sp. FL2044]
MSFQDLASLHSVLNDPHVSGEELIVFLIVIFVIAIGFFGRASSDTTFAAKNGCKPMRARFQHIPRHVKYGTTFSARALTRRGIFTIDPENVKTILAGRFQDYSLGDRPPIMGQLLGRGIFVSDGEDWSHSRALLRPNFVKDQIADLSLINGHIEDLLRLIHDDQPVDLQPLFLNFTLDSATEFLFGRSTNLLGTNDAADKAFSDSFNASLRDMALQFRMGPFRKLRRRTQEVTEAHNICRAYVDQFVDAAVEIRGARRSGSDIKTLSEEDSRNYFLKELAESTDDKEKIRDEILNILIAGRDTVASLLSSLFFVLARRPDLWKRVKDEVAQLGDGLPTYQQLRDMKFIRYCINEVLRLYPPVPSNTRVAVRNTVLPRGGGVSGDEPVLVSRGCVVIYSVFAMHRRKELFGDDAEEFRPERWANRKFSWEYLPFNGGPRICLGQQYAITEASLVLIRFAQEFSTIRPQGESEWKENLTLTLTPAGGVNVCMCR